MEAYTTLVNVDEGTAPKLISFIAGLMDDGPGAAFLKECNEIIDEQKTAALVTKILSQSEVILACEVESDAEGCFQAIVSILFSMESEEERHRIVESIVSTIVSTTELKRLRLKILVSLFNMLVSATSKFAVLIALLKYANETGQSSLVSKYHERVADWIVQWSLQPSSSRELYQLFSEILSKDGQAALSLAFLVKYLDTFTGQAYPPEVESLCKTAVLSAISSPVDSFQDRSKLYDTLSKQSFGGSELGKLTELLRILCGCSRSTP